MEVGAVAGGVAAVALEDSAAAHLVGEARVEVGNKLRHLRSLGTLNFTGAMCLLFIEADPNRAPIGVTAVPEPASVGLLAVAACGLAARRRRH